MNVISTSNAPAAIGPYSQALDTGSMVFVSGQLPVDPASGTMPATVEAQAAQSLANLKAILAQAGLGMANVVKTTIFLADINDFAAVNAVYAEAFTQPFPARSCVQVAAIPKGAKLEIECIAVREG
jgi:2-iminobutanoate/2-iminopropanoate deaminase